MAEGGGVLISCATPHHAHNHDRQEELAEGLHLIDFEQLKIENQTCNEKIEERNEELLKLRKKITTVVQVLTHVKEKAQFCIVGRTPGPRLPAGSCFFWEGGGGEGSGGRVPRSHPPPRRWLGAT
jgi:hypothetical protein